MNIQIFSSSQNFIHVAVSNVEDNMECDMTFVYGNPIFQQRRHLLGKLKSLQLGRNRQWCCVGDFNDHILQQKKEGLRPQPQNRMELF